MKHHPPQPNDFSVLACIKRIERHNCTGQPETEGRCTWPTNLGGYQWCFQPPNFQLPGPKKWSTNKSGLPGLNPNNGRFPTDLFGRRFTFTNQPCCRFSHRLSCHPAIAACNYIAELHPGATHTPNSCTYQGHSQGMSRSQTWAHQITGGKQCQEAENQNQRTISFRKWLKKQLFIEKITHLKPLNNYNNTHVMIYI